ncbi:MAG TPA: hypothetical protein PKY56_09030 [Candidatus Kapabacteria bacterium]|nr:hypothetical protein [Candidatus Kapabacteria bacterium]HPO63599.1 hypothetical protein [Candidatus Kapabacteria bacterium]
MEESKALSPEVKGLFDTIKHQAKEYTKAFDYLETQISELSHLKTYLEKFAEQIRNDFNTTTVDLNKSIAEFVNEVELKSEKIQKVYDNLDSIKELRDELYEANNRIKRQITETSTSLQNFKEKSELEINSALSNISNTIEKEIESNIQRLELNISLKLRQFQSKLLNYDQKIWALSDAQSRDYKNFVNEIFNTNNKIINIIKDYGDLKKSFGDRFNNIENDIKNFLVNQSVGFTTFSKEINAQDADQSIRLYAPVEENKELLEILKDDFEGESSKKSKTIIYQPEPTEKVQVSVTDDKYNELVGRLNELQKLYKSNSIDIDSLSSKAKISLSVAIISILIAILSLVI